MKHADILIWYARKTILDRGLAYVKGHDFSQLLDGTLTHNDNVDKRNTVEICRKKIHLSMLSITKQIQIDFMASKFDLLDHFSKCRSLLAHSLLGAIFDSALLMQTA